MFLPSSWFFICRTSPGRDYLLPVADGSGQASLVASEGQPKAATDKMNIKAILVTAAVSIAAVMVYNKFLAPKVGLPAA